MADNTSNKKLDIDQAAELFLGLMFADAEVAEKYSEEIIGLQETVESGALKEEGSTVEVSEEFYNAVMSKIEDNN